MAAESLSSYDELPYSSAPYAETHPRALRTLAFLLGVESPRLETARVLELGCACGGNLLPQAEEFPQARFVGIDLSRRQIEAGKLRVEQLGLNNAELRHESILDFDLRQEPFDYIIAHGVLSWVPPAVREGIFAICRELLAPQGVAVISFNAYPGCHLRDQARRMMQYHVAEITEPGRQIAESQAMLRYLQAHSPADSSQRAALDEVLNLLKAASNDSFFFHDFLEDHNQPFYLHEFDADVRRHGLQLLADTRLHLWQTRELTPESVRPFEELPYARREQYLDFLRNTSFRSMAVCRDSLSPDRNPQAVARRLESLHFRLKYPPSGFPAEVRAGAPLTFAGKRFKYHTAEPAAQAAMLHLSEAAQPNADFDSLLRAAVERGGAAGGNDARTILCRELYAAIGCDMLEVFRDPLRFSSRLPEKPRVANSARLESAHGNLVTNRCHRYVRLDDLGRFLLRYFDGGHDRRALCQRIEQGLADGRIQLKRNPDGTLPLPPGGWPALVEETVQVVGRSALLID